MTPARPVEAFRQTSGRGITFCVDSRIVTFIMIYSIVGQKSCNFRRAVRTAILR